VVCVAVLLTNVVALYYDSYYLPEWTQLDYWCYEIPDTSPRVANSCQLLSDHTPLFYVSTFLLLVVLLAVAVRWLARWTLKPVEDLIPAIAQISPQNLGYRLHREAVGKADELVPLARAIDEMMDRIAAGYEGQRRFAANASHELRTPLAVQRTLIEVGMTQALTPDRLSLLTAQLLETNERNERLIEGLLVLSEAEQGLKARLPQRLDAVAEAIIAAHQRSAADAGVTITSHLEPRVVLGEEVLLERLVTNLVQNAVKYNRPDGRIHVAVGAEPALTVVNTGQVVPANAVGMLFEPFKRLADRIDHSGGSGLGLAIARSITGAHGGTITAEPVEGGGLRIEVRLPVPLDERADRPKSPRHIRR
jgi:signal transduction histidine kinase